MSCLHIELYGAVCGATVADREKLNALIGDGAIPHCVHVQALLKAAADVADRTPDGVDEQNLVKMIDTLFEHGADVRGHIGSYSLSECTRPGIPDVIFKRLLDRGAWYTPTDGFSLGLLAEACINYHPGAVQFLVEQKRYDQSTFRSARGSTLLSHVLLGDVFTKSPRRIHAMVTIVERLLAIGVPVLPEHVRFVATQPLEAPVEEVEVEAQDDDDWFELVPASVVPDTPIALEYYCFEKAWGRFPEKRAELLRCLQSTLARRRWRHVRHSRWIWKWCEDFVKRRYRPDAEVVRMGHESMECVHHLENLKRQNEHIQSELAAAKKQRCSAQ